MRFVRLTGVLCLVLCCAGGVDAQSGQKTEALRQKYEKKLSSPFVAKIGWVREFSSAKERARSEGKPILAYFTRSYSP